jgi:CheY-like chemotaxis protein
MNGEECVNAYKAAIQSLIKSGEMPSDTLPFDAIVLDYRMPKVDGLAAAQEILRINRNQRIIFASAYVKQTLAESVKQFEQVIELIQKPFEPKVLVELVEDTAMPAALHEINRLIGQFDPSKPSDEQIEQLLDVLKKAQKVGLC